MDFDEALKLLNSGPQGIDEGNRRRAVGQGIPNLSDADLSFAHLGGANLSGGNLRRANLTGANLTKAELSGANLARATLIDAHLTDSRLSDADLVSSNLSGGNLSGANIGYANLSGANLSGANLKGANLSYANLSGASLSGANLSDANLADTNLSGADVSGADLSGGICAHTLFAEVDLSCVKGLDSLVHVGPSSISTDTIFLSAGKIPEAFLRGCGVPEALIKYLPSLIGSMSPIQFYSCFISYSHKDEKFAERLHNELQGNGVRRWYAPHDLPIGAKIRPVIDESILVYDKLLLVLSEHSVNSQWVEQEVETALRREREQDATVLFPVRLDDAAFSIKGGWPSLVTNTRNIGDFQNWKEHDMFQATFARLLRDLKASEVAE